jgi:hypothetical protein
MGVVNQFEVFELELVNVRHIFVQLQKRERVRDPLQLLFQRLYVIQVDVSVTETVDELSALQPAHLGKHAC